jgi:phenylacetate-CoA ligase
MLNFPRVLYYLGLGLQRLRWKEDKLKRYQNERVRSIVRNAYDYVPFYHRIFKLHDISPEDVKTVEDLSKLLVIKKDEFRKINPKELISIKYNPAILKPLRTSGSSGQPLTIYVNNAEADWRRAIYMRANISCGQRPRDVWAFITDPRHFGDTTEIQRRLGVFAQTLIPVYGGPTVHLQLLQKVQPDVLDGYSGVMFLVAKEANRQGIDKFRLRLMFGSVDSVDLSQRAFMEKVFGAPYLDQYGCSEVNRMAWQCHCKSGYHIDADSVIIETVDSTGKPVGNRESGEVVITSLYNFAMPFIRYSLGDVGRLSDYRCSCGRVLPLMEIVEGRRDSFLTLPDGRVVSPMVFVAGMKDFSFFDQIDQYRVIQKKKNHIQVFLKFNVLPVDIADVTLKVKRHVKHILGVVDSDFFVDVQFVDDIPLSRTGRLMTTFSEIAS